MKQDTQLGKPNSLDLRKKCSNGKQQGESVNAQENVDEEGQER
ncbi:MAG: hypothetical protein QW520_08915 [Methanomassiliicoccales archaeon]